MTPSRNRTVAWVAAVFVVAIFGLLVFFWPLVATALFLACVTFLAIAACRSNGIWTGVKFFLKEILFKW